MPKNNNLEPVKLPMKLKFGEASKTEFKVLEDDIKVELVDGPTEESLLQWIPQFANATWNETANERVYNEDEKYDTVVKALSRKTLPTVLENIRFTFKISGITYVEVSHLLRHRQASFSAYCSGDVQLHDCDVMIPEAIENSPEYAERYKDLMKQCKELYVDMVNSKKISLMDARYALPVSRNQAYFMSMPFNVLLAFINQRIDTAIQPKSDNLIAYQMWYEVCKQIPVLSKLNVVDLNAPAWFFIKQARTGHSTNLYFPEPQNDKFEWNENDFIYQCMRDELNGTENIESSFQEKKQFYINEIEKLQSKVSEKFDEAIKNNR